jgi:lipid II:glycine glycyltransferase (peptidoglycan interpeptide bridge formation enzyme)
VQEVVRSGLDAKHWDQELSSIVSPAPLTQSWIWGEIQSAVGWKPIRLEVAGESPVLVLVQGSGLLRWGYIPRGPVGCSPKVLEGLIDWAHRAGLMRLRIEPETGPELCSLLAAMGFNRTADMQPSHTRIVQLDSPVEMLASFRRTTRYNIGYAERNQVTVDEGADAAELARHVLTSAAHNRVNLPGSAYFRLLLDRLPSCRTFVARHAGDSLCAILVAVHDGRGYYLFSGTSRCKGNLKAMELTMWQAMRYAARSGCRDYDMWGVAPVEDQAHPWSGFTEFKRGFGGRTVEYAGTWDLVLSPTGAFALDTRDRAAKIFRRVRRTARLAAA